MMNLEFLILSYEIEKEILDLMIDIWSFPNSDYLNMQLLQDKFDSLEKYKLKNEILFKFESLLNEFQKSETQELMVEYSRLFVGPFHVIAPPYGSFYFENGKIMGDSTIQVEKYYIDAGIQINEAFKDLPDHILAELEFLSILSYNKIQNLKENKFSQYEIIQNYNREFFNKLFLNWVLLFFGQIKSNTTNNYYKLASEFSLIVVEFLRKNLDLAVTTN